MGTFTEGEATTEGEVEVESAFPQRPQQETLSSGREQADRLGQLARHYTDSSRAYDSYIKGRYCWSKRTPDGLKKAVSYFEDAILEDPKYALAYAGLADCYTVSRLFEEVRPSDVMTKAKSAAQMALELDDSLAEAHASFGYVLHRYSWDFGGAEREFKRALELKPEYSTTHQWYGCIWYPSGNLTRRSVNSRKLRA